MKKIFGFFKKGVKKLMDIAKNVVNSNVELQIEKIKLVEHMVDVGADLVEKSAKGTVSTVEKTVKGTVSTVEKTVKGTVSTVEKTVKGTIEFIKDNPVILISIGVGIIVQNKLLSTQKI